MYENIMKIMLNFIKCYRCERLHSIW